jgi:hypothetical protein
LKIQTKKNEKKGFKFKKGRKKEERKKIKNKSTIDQKKLKKPDIM